MLRRRVSDQHGMSSAQPIAPWSSQIFAGVSFPTGLRTILAPFTVKILSTLMTESSGSPSVKVVLLLVGRRDVSPGTRCVPGVPAVASSLPRSCRFRAEAAAHRRTLSIGDELRLNIAGPCPRCFWTTRELPKDSGILRTWPGTIRNVNVYASVSRGGTIRRGDPVGRCAEAHASTNRATDAVKPCKKFFPPTGPISPEQLKPARGKPPSFSHTNEAS